MELNYMIIMAFVIAGALIAFLFLKADKEERKDIIDTFLNVFKDLSNKKEK